MDLLQRARRAGFAALVVSLGAFDAHAVDCLTSSDQTACGYHCLGANGEVRCAQTPDGVCAFSSGVLACWDPPLLLRRVYGQGAVPRPSCVTNNGQTACGYQCVVSSDQAQCAQTPFGACRVNAGRIACWDPPADVLLARGERTPVATCVASCDRVVCGYHCDVWQGVVRCAQTPDGVCRHQGGPLTCWDPPLDTFGVVYDAPAERACIAASDGRTCGFRCLATPHYSGCGSDRRDSCRADADARRVVCAAPE